MTNSVDACEVSNHKVLDEALNFRQSTILLNHTEQVLATQIRAVGSGKTSIACYPILQTAYIARVGILGVQYTAMPLNQVI